MKIKKQVEFNDVISDILKNEEIIGLRYEYHHGISRLDHSLNVARLTFNMCKLFKIEKIEEVTRAALLHDFYFDKELTKYDAYEKLSKHPVLALQNALKYYDLTPLEQDIIVKHMYPHTNDKPKYIGSYLVSVCDKVVATYEMTRFKVSLRLGIYLIFIYNVVSIRIQQ